MQNSKCKMQKSRVQTELRLREVTLSVPTRLLLFAFCLLHFALHAFDQFSGAAPPRPPPGPAPRPRAPRPPGGSGGGTANATSCAPEFAVPRTPTPAN